MTNSSSNHLAAALTKRHVKTFLLFAAAIGIAIISFHSGRTSEARSKAFRERHAQVQACMELGNAVNCSVKLARHNHISPEEFGKWIGLVEPVDQMKHSEAKPADTHIYYHPKSQRAFYLRFTEEGLMGYHSSHGPDDIKIPLPEILAG